MPPPVKPQPPKRPAAPPAQQVSERTHIARYGRWWKRLPGVPKTSAGYDLLQEVAIEKYICGNYDAVAALPGSQLNPWTWHFRRFISLMLDRPETNPRYRFEWNPYAMRMLEEAYKNNFLAVAGHASCSKSEFFALYAIGRFLIGARFPESANSPAVPVASPEYVKVFITSTSLDESRGRIWGVVEGYWAEICRFFGGEQYMQAKLISSTGKIVRINSDGRQNQLSGITLVAGGKGQDKDASTKIGFKNRCVIFIADELPLLTHALYNTAITNLQSNDYLQFIGIGNPTSAFDPLGVFMEPEEGWASVDETFDGWKTKRGYCIRFDGEKSPNVLAGREVWKGILSLRTVTDLRESLGPKSPEYYRMVRGYLSPDGDANAIYTEVELISSGSQGKVTTWLDSPEMIAFLDPAFSHGGDEAPMCVAKLGQYHSPIHQRSVKGIERVETINLMALVDASNKEVDRNQQLVNLFHAECDKRGIKVENRGVDSTGAGDPFSTLMAITMGRGFQMVSFAGAPSDKTVGPTNSRSGKDRFANRVSELWYVGKDFMKAGQIRGLDPETCIQMCARMYKLVDREKVEVESKKIMKQRTNGRSPDRADAFFGCIEIARRRHGLSSLTRAAARTALPSAPENRTAYRQAALESTLSGRSGKARFSDLNGPTLSGANGFADSQRFG